MGNKASRAAHGSHGTGATPRAPKLTAVAPFTLEETEALYQHFASLRSAESPASPFELSLGDLKRELGISAGHPAMFLERVLALMDGNGDGILTFTEFAEGVAAFSPNATEAKYKFTFRLYDVERRGAISPADLKSMLGGVLKEYGVGLADAQLDRMVSQTFAQFDLNRDGLIDFEEYRAMVVQNPSMLKPLTINAGELLKGGK